MVEVTLLEAIPESEAMAECLQDPMITKEVGVAIGTEEALQSHQGQEVDREEQPKTRTVDLRRTSTTQVAMVAVVDMEILTVIEAGIGSQEVEALTQSEK